MKNNKCNTCELGKNYNLNITYSYFNQYKKAMSYLNQRKDACILEPVLENKLIDYIAKATGICVHKINEKIK
jgi:hypothetical protein